MNLLTMEHVTKAYTDRVLLDDVAFGINENEKIVVIGINGMGKSTLLKIVAGVEEYDSGKLSMGNTVKICICHRHRCLERKRRYFRQQCVESSVIQISGRWKQRQNLC